MYRLEVYLGTELVDRKYLTGKEQAYKKMKELRQLGFGVVLSKLLEG